VNTRVLEGLSSHVIGDCDAADQAVWQNEFPDGGSGGSPDGAQIDVATTGTARLFMAGRARLVVGTFPPLDKKRTAWTLKVIEKLK
jgi:hypothetical protein